MDLPVTSGPLPVGAPAPDVQLMDADGRTVSMASFRGQSVLLVFFPSGWDPTRRQQIELYNEFVPGAPGGSDADATAAQPVTRSPTGEPATREAPTPVKVLGVSYDGVWCELDVAGDKAQTIRFPLLSDAATHSAAARRFGVEGCQAAFVIDASGIVRWRHVAPFGTQPSLDALRDALDQRDDGYRLSRRQFLMSAVAASLLAAMPPPLARAQDEQRRSRAIEPGARSIVLDVNGAQRKLSIDPRVTLLDALRERLGLFGTKKGCDHGQCGACTVHVNGRRVNSCLMLAMQAEGAKVTTIEGLARGDTLHPVQAAFVKHDGFQCGYCTPGQIMSAVACIAEGHARSEEEIREWMSGNICRCGAYRGICKAVAEARAAGGAT